MAAPAPLRPSCPAFIWLCRFLALLILTVAAQAAPKWDPVNKDELAETKGKVDPDAGAEILLREATMDHSHFDWASDAFFIRVKIFNESGISDFAKIDLEYEKGTKIHDVEARTIKPDGTIVELNPKDIFERVLIKTGNIRQKVISFAPPGIEPGAIVEYRFRAVTNDASGLTPLFFQSDHPARIVRYRIKPIDTQSIERMWVQTMFINCPKQPTKPDKDDYLNFEMTDLPAAKDEPFQPPAINNLMSVLLYYKYSVGRNKDTYRQLEDSATITKLIRAAVEKNVKPEDSDLEKLEKLYDFCRAKIINRDRDSSGLTSEQLKKLKPNETASDTLKSGSGTREDINILFATLVRAASLKARLAECNDRSLMLYDKSAPEYLQFSDIAIEVLLKTGRYFCNPGAGYLPFNMIPWENTDTSSLIWKNPRDTELVTIDGPPPEKSKLERKATFTLDADGTLEGDVTETYSGYREADMKYDLDAQTPTERETYLRDALQSRQKLAEITAIVVENAADPLATLKISYHLRIPEYADRTGTRIFFQPAVFQKGAPLWFEAATRRTDIRFDYRYITHDDLRITPPEGYTLEEASAPKALDMGALANYEASIGVHRKTNAVLFQRQFTLRNLAFNKKFYPAIKCAFEELHKADNHTLTLKRTEPLTRQNSP